MDAAEIKELIDLISNSEFEEFVLEKGDFKLKLVKQRSGGEPQVVFAAAPSAAAPLAHPVVAAPAGGAPPLAADPAAVGASAPGAVADRDDGTVAMPSPIVGTYYSAANPDSEPFVKPGDRVTKGQTLCIIEAMKVMNEIEAEQDAEVVAILVSNGQPVEYDEPLFKLKPL